MERYPSPKLAAQMQFFYLKTVLKLNKKCKTMKTCQYLEHSWKYGKILEVSVYGATFRCSTKKDYWFQIPYIEKKVPNWKLFLESKNEFRQQVCGLGIFPYCYHALLNISIKSGADSCITPLVR